MSDVRHLERDLPELLVDLARPVVPYYRDDIVQLTADTRQRAAWTFPERWLPVDTTLRRSPVAAPNLRRLALLGLLVLAAVVAVIVATGAVRKPPLPPYGPAANGAMVYEAGSNIFLVDPTTGATRPIADGRELDSDPRFSPDGTKIAFVRYAGNGSYGVVADADGSNIHRMPGPTCTDCTGWGWMGDSRTIFATSTAAGSEIMLHDTITGEHSSIDAPGEVLLAAPRPPDDLEIGFITQLTDDRAALYSVNRDGTGLKQLAITGESQSFAFSPDGSQIAYDANAVGVDAWTIHIIRSDGTGDTELPTAPWLIHQGGPTWSPDGQSLLVWRTYSTEPSPIFSILRPDGELIRDIEELEIAGDWALSPDGASLVYVTNVATARETGRCPTGDDATCPSVVVDVSDGSIAILPFKPFSLSYQRVSP